VRASRLGLALVLTIGLAACSRSGRDTEAGGSNMALIDAGDETVAKVCASDETLDGLKALVLNSIATTKTTPPINEADRAELGTGGHVVLDAPILSSFDKTTRKATCHAKVSFVWPPDIMDRLKTANAAKTWTFAPMDADYTVQPQADGRAVVYALDEAVQDKAASTVVSVLKTLARAEIAAQAPPPPSAGAVSRSAAASDPTVDPDATGDTSMRKQQAN